LQEGRKGMAKESLIEKYRWIPLIIAFGSIALLTIGWTVDVYADGVLEKAVYDSDFDYWEKLEKGADIFWKIGIICISISVIIFITLLKDKK